MGLNLNILPLCTCIIFVSIQSTCCQRRIVNGIVSKSQPKYLAYFLKSSNSDPEYLGWLCGGAIIHPLYILTSAACLEEVRHVYAITGYNKYVKSEDIDNDDCTKRIKKKVVSRAFQRDNNEHNTQFQWNSRDISLAEVESPYDFRDPTYMMYCSYFPAMIRVNYYKNFEIPGTQVVTFGWGHKKYYRQVEDLSDHNEEFVHYAPTVVIDKETCKHLLDGHDDIKAYVNLYLLCTSGQGDLDESGKLILDLAVNDTQTCYKRSNGNYDLMRRNVLNIINTTSDSSTTNNLNISTSHQVNYRRNGPCQNDHGGPLVTWIGGREYVIGVACGFQVNKEMECVGPYLYTSTYRNGEFIFCKLRYSRRSRRCDKLLEENSYQIIEEQVDWNENNVSRSITATTRDTTIGTPNLRAKLITDNLTTLISSVLTTELSTEPITNLTTTNIATAEENQEQQNSLTEEISVIVETS